MTILEIVRMLPGVPDTVPDELLTLHIDIITRQILNHVNRTELPDGLIYVAAQMVVDIFNETTQDGKTGGVSSVSEAGRSVSFNSALVQLAVENKLEERKAQLDSFRLPYRITERMGGDGV